MKQLLKVQLILLLCFILPGCWDRSNIENMSFLMTVGLDLDADNKLLIYTNYPVFDKKAKKKQDDFGVKAVSLRQARGVIDSKVDGLAIGNKTQIIFLGKRLLEKGDWFSLLDVYYRDTRNSLSAKVVAVDGPVSEVIKLEPKDKAQFYLYVSELIDLTSKRYETVKTTLDQLHKQMYDKSLTPYVPKVKVEKIFELQGTALLNKKGLVVDSLGLQENALLMMLQKKVSNDVSLTVRVPGIKGNDMLPFMNNTLSFSASDVKTKIKVSHTNQFQFDIRVSMDFALTERNFKFDTMNQGEQLEAMINEQLQKQFNDLIQKIQKHKIDPIGLGLYARASQHTAWQGVQYDWGDALSKAEVKVAVDTRLKSVGPIK